MANLSEPRLAGITMSASCKSRTRRRVHACKGRRSSLQGQRRKQPPPAARRVRKKQTFAVRHYLRHGQSSRRPSCLGASMMSSEGRVGVDRQEQSRPRIMPRIPLSEASQAAAGDQSPRQSRGGQTTKPRCMETGGVL